MGQDFVGTTGRELPLRGTAIIGRRASLENRTISNQPFSKSDLHFLSLPLRNHSYEDEQEARV